MPTPSKKTVKQQPSKFNRIEPASTVGNKLASLAAEAANVVTPPHLIIIARAGTGKTTTLVKALAAMRGIVDPAFVPSPQQQAVFDQVKLSPTTATACFVAFNKSIADELASRVPAGCDAMTMHSMGYKAVNRALGYQKPGNYATEDLAAELLGVNSKDFKRTNPILLGAIASLVELCKQNLIDADDPDEIDRLVRHYEVELGKDRDRIFDMVPLVIEASKSPKGTISFTDMIWLPVVLDLPLTKYDVLLVDEFQDLNRCQQALAKMAGKRIIGCGDDKQAIYGFAGADSESISRMIDELGRQGKYGRCRENPPCSSRMDYECDDCGQPRCVVLPLTVTRRCGKAIVAEAQKLVPDFEAHESNCEGKITSARFPSKDIPWEKSYGAITEDGDMVLCRVNAPLVSQCFRFIKAGRKATIRGRDAVKGLISTVNKMKAVDCVDLIHKLSEWSNLETAKEQAKKNPSEQRLIAITDRFDCLLCFTEGAKTVEEVTRKIEQVFVDRQCPRCRKPYGQDVQQCYDCKCSLVQPEGVRLSSIHKAKGLEAKRVFLLQPKGATVPHPSAKSAWQLDQEYNLKYVAITRAIEELCYVS
jgi:DNA helicase II / ATP-dependent DNA helicase PcrA